MKEVLILGADEPRGAYLLRIQITTDLNIRFGRFQKGAKVPVPRGELVYVGSAMAQSGSMTLARRSLRHATRRPPLPPHNVRQTLISQLVLTGLAPENLRAPENKKLFWNIDYLLDQEAAHLRQLFLLRTNHSLESDLAKMLLADPACKPLAPGLGAHDSPGSTHLLHVRAGSEWWADLPTRLDFLLHANEVNPDRK